MNAITILLPVLLILTAVALFLCILNLLSLRELSGKMRDLQGRGGEMPGPILPTGKSPETSTAADQEGGGDIASGIRLIAGKYCLDSLVITSRDGLVVASAGSSDPESEAAYYSDLLSRGTSVPDTSVRLVEFAYRGIPLIGIARGGRFPSEETAHRMTTDISSIFERMM
jgi:hypothetical protein